MAGGSGAGIQAIAGREYQSEKLVAELSLDNAVLQENSS